jgi:hypothetical protein
MELEIRRKIILKLILRENGVRVWSGVNFTGARWETVP